VVRFRVIARTWAHSACGEPVIQGNDTGIATIGDLSAFVE
jgi:hypothetical protein